LLKLKRGSRFGAYRPWPRLAGRLDGVYRADVDIPPIRFAPDGKFVDEGFQGYLGALQALDGGVRTSNGSEERRLRAPGRGRYLIRDNTLELQYEDERVARFTMLASPEDVAVRPLARFSVAGRTLMRTAGGGDKEALQLDAPRTAPLTQTPNVQLEQPATSAAASATSPLPDRCSYDRAATRASLAADAIYFARRADGGTTGLTLLSDGTAIDGRPLVPGLADAARLAVAVAERRRNRPADVQRWAASAADAIILCSGERIVELRIEDQGLRLGASSKAGSYLRSPDISDAQLRGRVWRARDVRDRFVGIEFSADGRFNENGIAQYLGFAEAPMSERPRTGLWRLLGRYTLELKFDDSAHSELVSVLLDPYEQGAGTLFIGHVAFTPRRK
jgi:hypothetical protein